MPRGIVKKIHRYNKVKRIVKVTDDKNLFAVFHSNRIRGGGWRKHNDTASDFYFEKFHS